MRSRIFRPANCSTRSHLPEPPRPAMPGCWPIHLRRRGGPTLIIRHHPILILRCAVRCIRTQERDINNPREMQHNRNADKQQNCHHYQECNQQPVYGIIGLGRGQRLLLGLRRIVAFGILLHVWFLGILWLEVWALLRGLGRLRRGTVIAELSDTLSNESVWYERSTDCESSAKLSSAPAASYSSSSTRGN